MLLFDGTYRLGGYARKSQRSAAAAKPSWRIRIIDLAVDAPDIRHLRPFIVHAARNPGSVFPAHCADTLGPRILRDFGLKIRNVLWIESSTEAPHRLRVAVFRIRSVSGNREPYTIRWRPIQENERLALSRSIPETLAPP